MVKETESKQKPGREIEPEKVSPCSGWGDTLIYLYAQGMRREQRGLR